MFLMTWKKDTRHLISAFNNIVGKCHGNFKSVLRSQTSTKSDNPFPSIYLLFLPYLPRPTNNLIHLHSYVELCYFNGVKIQVHSAMRMSSPILVQAAFVHPVPRITRLRSRCDAPITTSSLEMILSANQVS